MPTPDTTDDQERREARIRRVVRSRDNLVAQRDRDDGTWHVTEPTTGVVVMGPGLNFQQLEAEYAAELPDAPKAVRPE